MSTPGSKTAALDAPLHIFGFEFEDLSPRKVSGRLRVTPICCQSWSAEEEVLHGGVSAVIAEALASIGAHMACGFDRIAGVQLSINHFAHAVVGDVVFAEAVPQYIVKTLQVWEVKIRKVEPSDRQKQTDDEVVAISRVAVLTNMSVPENATAARTLKQFAKL
uniref:Thioesterase domain-containing protein n=1 Tax=Kalanchoe fedtschenkoi TaxID=63787 RepID=A0A7N1A3E0_KALFE